MTGDPDVPDDGSDEQPDGVPAEAPEAAEDAEDAEEHAAEGGFWVDPDHDESGLELARTIARSMAGAAQQAPRRRKARRGPGDRRVRPRASGAHPDERDPQLLDSSLGRLVADQGWSLDLTVHSVFGRWAAIVGEEVARHTEPTAFTDGRLVVRADSTAWATQLRLLAPALVRRLNEDLGHGSVTVIEVEGPNLPSWKKGRLSSRDGRGPRDTYG